MGGFREILINKEMADELNYNDNNSNYTFQNYTDAYNNSSNYTFQNYTDAYNNSSNYTFRNCTIDTFAYSDVFLSVFSSTLIFLLGY